MRFMVLVPGSPESEAGEMPSTTMAFGPDAGLELVDALAEEPALRAYHLLPSVRADILLRLGRADEARQELVRAADLCDNDRERELLLSRALACGA